MTTNGILLKDYAKDLKNAGLNRLNISLDTLNEEKYSQITKVGRSKMYFKVLKQLKRVGLLQLN